MAEDEKKRIHVDFRDQDSLLRDYFEKKALSDALDKELKELKESIKKSLLEKEGDRILSGVEASGKGYYAIFDFVESSRFDSAKFKKENHEMYEAYKVSTTQERLTVKQYSESILDTPMDLL